MSFFHFFGGLTCCVAESPRFRDENYATLMRARVGVTRNCRLKDFDPKTWGTATGKHNGAPQRGTTVANKKKLINLKRKQKYRIQFIKYSSQYIQFFFGNDFSSRILSTFCLKILTDSFSIYILPKRNLMFSIFFKNNDAV